MRAYKTLVRHVTDQYLAQTALCVVFTDRYLFQIECAPCTTGGWGALWHEDGSVSGRRKP